MMEALQPALQAMSSSTFLRSWRRFLCLFAVLVLFSPLPATHARADPPPALMLAGRWQPGLDPSACWVSEKLDGVRAYWDGQRLRFRSGRPIAAPAWFTAGLPARALDGELWLGRGRFAELSGLVRREAGDDRAWQQVRYMIFDLPGEQASFELRLRRLHEVIAAAALPWVQAVPQFRVDDEVALAATLARVVAGGGEGLMLHRADARWQAGRSDALLKLTPFLDAEARVVAHLPGKGRHAGVLGALELESADGRRFRVGTGLSDAQRREPPAIGSLVSYRYRELTAKGMPRFPVFLRVRSPGAD
jgi:DNA ligase-1